MPKFRHAIVVLGMLFCSAAYSDVQVSIGIGLPYSSIGMNLPAYPELAVVPGYPVYYAPRLDANYFFNVPNSSERACRKMLLSFDCE